MGRDGAGAHGAVAEVGGYDEGAPAADLHGGDALVPPLDHLALAERELERLAAVDRAVELGALLAALIEPAGIVHHTDLALLGEGAGADLEVGHLQPRG